MGVVGLGRGLLLILLWKSKNHLGDSGSLAQDAARLCRRRLGARVKTNWTIRGASREYALVFESHAQGAQAPCSSSPAQIKKAPLRELSLFVLAERVGFEPTVRFNVRLISSQVHSTTLPPLRLLRSIHSNWHACLNEALF